MYIWTWVCDKTVIWSEADKLEGKHRAEGPHVERLASSPAAPRNNREKDIQFLCVFGALESQGHRGWRSKVSCLGRVNQHLINSSQEGHRALGRHQGPLKPVQSHPSFYGWDQRSEGNPKGHSLSASKKLCLPDHSSYLPLGFLRILMRILPPSLGLCRYRCGEGDYGWGPFKS